MTQQSPIFPAEAEGKVRRAVTPVKMIEVTSDRTFVFSPRVLPFVF